MGFWSWFFSLFNHEGRIEKDIDQEEKPTKKLLEAEERQKRLEKIDEVYDLRENKDIKKSSKYLNKAYKYASQATKDKIIIMLKQEAQIRNNNLMSPNKDVRDQEILTKQNAVIEKKLIENLKILLAESEKDNNKQLTKILKKIEDLYIEEFNYEKRKFRLEEKELKEEVEIKKRSSKN